jgi:hypothetical protein
MVSSSGQGGKKGKGKKKGKKKGKGGKQKGSSGDDFMGDFEGDMFAGLSMDEVDAMSQMGLDNDNDSASLSASVSVSASASASRSSSKRPWSAWEICEAFARMRNYRLRGSKGQLDTFKAAVDMIKDALNGTVPLFFLPPPLE